MIRPERKLYLIPSTLGDTEITKVIPAYNLNIMNTLAHFVVEEERTARRFLIRCGYTGNINTILLYLLNEHTPSSEIPLIFTRTGASDLGLISEAGLPGVADPGALLVQEAHRLNIKVVPLAGPSSLLIALMASGLNGQQFSFNGYLPVKPHERSSRIRFFEKRSETENQSQIFIETPYRNNQLLDALISNLKSSTRLCIAVNLTLNGEWIKTKMIRDWKLIPPPDLKRQPAVFIFQA